MATPMTPAQSKVAFLAEGLRVVEIPGHQTNDRSRVTGGAAGPKYGLVNHHIGAETTNPYAYAAGILFKGYSGLPGPLCHEGLDVDTGTLYMIGTGRTNHAGGGDPAVLAAVKAETVPYDRELKPTKGNSDGVDGNAPFYGLEAMYSGSRDVPRIGYIAMVKWNVARCRFHGWSGASCIAHREWSNDKPDPGRVSLPQLRRDVDAALAMPAGAWGTNQPPPPAQEDDDMSQAQVDAIIAHVKLNQYILENQVRPFTVQLMQKVDALTALVAADKDVTADEIRQIVEDAVAKTPVDEASRGFDVLAAELAPDCAEPSRHNV